MAKDWSILIIVWTMFSTPAESVDECSVYPTDAVATVGERIRLTCSANEHSTILFWHIQHSLTETVSVYVAPTYTHSSTGPVLQMEKLAKGYFATHPANNETTLHINETSLSQAGLYVCTCSDASKAYTKVIVLDSEPNFTTDYSFTDGEPVTFSCSVSFNASADVYYELKIEDALGFTVARKNASTVDTGLIVCALKHQVTANASSDQWHTCNVTLGAKGSGIIYSRLLNATVKWQSISSTAEFLSSVNLPHEERDEETSKPLAIGLSVTIFAVIVPIAVVVYFIMRSKIRSKMGQPHDQSSDCQQRPANQYDKNKIGCPTPEVAAKSCHDAAQHGNKSLKETELVLCENELYAETPKQLDPSDGYFAEEAIYNEIK